MSDERAKLDMLLLDIERRTEQLRRLESPRLRRLMIQAAIVLTTLLGGGAAIGALVTTLLHR
jgi:cell division septal protein FtsQ